MTNRSTILFFMFMIQMGESVYSSFSPGHKEHSQSAHEALLRAKLLSNDNNEDKQDCTEGNFLFILFLIVCQLLFAHSPVLLKLAEGCSERDTHLMLGYLMAITTVHEW